MMNKIASLRLFTKKKGNVLPFTGRYIREILMQYLSSRKLTKNLQKKILLKIS